MNSYPGAGVTARPFHTAVTFAAGLLLGAVVFGWPVDQAYSWVDPPHASAVEDRCTGGNEVSRFVCRNTWIRQHDLSYR